MKIQLVNNNTNFKQFVKNDSYKKSIDYLKQYEANPLNKQILKSMDYLENEQSLYKLEIKETPSGIISLYKQNKSNNNSFKKIATYNFFSNDLTEALLCTVHSLCESIRKGK